MPRHQDLRRKDASLHLLATALVLVTAVLGWLHW